jgi:hypothetical protein
MQCIIIKTLQLFKKYSTLDGGQDAARAKGLQ